MVKDGLVLLCPRRQRVNSELQIWHLFKGTCGNFPVLTPVADPWRPGYWGSRPKYGNNLPRHEKVTAQGEWNERVEGKRLHKDLGGGWRAEISPTSPDRQLDSGFRAVPLQREAAPPVGHAWQPHLCPTSQSLCHVLSLGLLGPGWGAGEGPAGRGGWRGSQPRNSLALVPHFLGPGYK